MKPLHVAAIFFRPRHEVQRTCRPIDDRSALDTNVADDVLIGADDVGDGYWRHRRWICKVLRPQWSRRGAIGIERVDLVVHRDDVHHVAQRSLYIDSGQVQRLRVYGPVYGVRIQFAELIHIDVRGRQRRLAEVRSSSWTVIAARDNVDLCVEHAGDKYRRRNDRYRNYMSYAGHPVKSSADRTR